MPCIFRYSSRRGSFPFSSLNCRALAIRRTITSGCTPATLWSLFRSWLRSNSSCSPRVTSQRRNQFPSRTQYPSVGLPVEMALKALDRVFSDSFFPDLDSQDGVAFLLASWSNAATWLPSQFAAGASKPQGFSPSKGNNKKKDRIEIRPKKKMFLSLSYSMM